MSITKDNKIMASDVTTALNEVYDYTTDVAQNILEAAKNVAEGDSESTSSGLLVDIYHELGSWWISLDGSIPSGGLPHLGHICTRATYGDFWTWCEENKTVVSDSEWLAYAESHNGCCPYYSSGDGSTTFRTPSYDQSFLKVLANISATGEMQEAGLPNITGTVPSTRAYNATGAFYKISGTGYNHGSGMGGESLGFNASLSNAIYGNSDTVTPQNFGIIVGVYAVGAVSAPVGETDVASLLNGLNTLEIEKLSRADTAEIIGWMMPDYTAGVNIGSLPLSSSPYTAPAHGWGVFFFKPNNTTHLVYVNGVATNFAMRDEVSGAAMFQSLSVPLSQGDEIYISANGYSDNSFYFYPLKGAN